MPLTASAARRKRSSLWRKASSAFLASVMSTRIPDKQRPIRAAARRMRPREATVRSTPSAPRTRKSASKSLPSSRAAWMRVRTRDRSSA